MSDPAITFRSVVHAAETAAKIASIPIRNPAWQDPTFWSYPLNETRTRPVPANSGWLNYIVIDLRLQQGFAPEDYTIRLKGFVATGQVDPATSGLEYRFVRGGQMLPTQEFDITDNIERHLERSFPFPYPCFHRRLMLLVTNDSQIVLQVRNASGTPRLAFASLYGYYYPNLGGAGRGTQESPEFMEEREDDGRF
jgi:hypothetical protein